MIALKALSSTLGTLGILAHFRHLIHGKTIPFQGNTKPGPPPMAGSKMGQESLLPLDTFEHVNHAKGLAPCAVFHLFSQKNQRIEGPQGIDIPAVDVMCKFNSDRFVT